MYHTTGFSSDEITTLCSMVAERFQLPTNKLGRKPVLGLFKSVAVTLCYLRRNHVQQELAEWFGASQATISRTIARYVPLLGELLGDWVPTVEDLDPECQLIIDGTLLPCWSWADHPELWSGKHHTTGLNVQVACTLDGDLAWVCDPMPGRVHDAKAIRDSGLIDTDNHPEPLGDKGYIGLGMITPKRKPPDGELLDWQKKFNTQVNSIRYQIERAIANLQGSGHSDGRESPSGG
jgi:DDE superfamily endonuclease/Helix-turn-helix of DDE superfamily endonuclease